MTARCTFAALLFLSLFSLVSPQAFAQDQAPLAIVVTPGGQLPLGPSGAGGQPFYTMGGGVSLAVEYALPSASGLFVQGTVGYSLLPTIVQTSLSLVNFGAGFGFRSQWTPKLEAQANVTGGYALGFYEGDPLGGTPFVSSEVRFSLSLLKGFILGVGISYNHFFNAYNGVGISFGASFRPQFKPVSSNLTIEQIQLQPVFPIFHKYYDDHIVGSAVIRNDENGTINDVRVSFYVPQYMAAPKECGIIDELAKGERRDIELFALFKDEILGITEDTKVPAQVLVSYTYQESSLKTDLTQSLRVYNRNAMVWDDDRKAASFVNAKDPILLQVAKTVAGEIRRRGPATVNLPLREAIGLYSSLQVYGVNYVIDPSSSYSVASADGSIIDFLQFPIQTMYYRGGDCDDLSILYAALLEAVGIETAFVSIPGHIFVAFNAGKAANQAVADSLDLEKVIIRDGQVWIPVETTLIKNGFLKAWQEGARQWTESVAQGTAVFSPIHEAWNTYEPVASVDVGITLTMPKQDDILLEYQRQIAQYSMYIIQPRAESLLEQIKSSGEDPSLLNRLGVLFARFGVLEEATTYFEKASSAGHLAGTINLGNVAIIVGDYKKALGCFSWAAENDPASVAAVQGLARANYELENYGTAKELYAQLKELSPETAEKVGYLLEQKKSDAMDSEDITEWIDRE